MQACCSRAHGPPGAGQPLLRKLLSWVCEHHNICDAALAGSAAAGSTALGLSRAAAVTARHLAKRCQAARASKMRNWEDKTQSCQRAQTDRQCIVQSELNSVERAQKCGACRAIVTNEHDACENN